MAFETFEPVEDSVAGARAKVELMDEEKDEEGEWFAGSPATMVKPW